jgi:aspartyl-tRNA(Asn)/glutamyl-tRNA(Gln) amidotransferase subunit A
MKTLAFATIAQLKQKLAAREISESELISFFLDRSNKYNSQLNAAIEVFDRNSIDQQERKTGALSGIPGMRKDNIAQQGQGLSCASNILKNFVSTYDATAISRLKDVGAPIIGRANLDEFAMGSSNETSAFGPVRNPWDIERVPGGSSGGPAAAVAAGMVPWALGSDTGASVRNPAAWCGITGLKPTYGLVSRYGLVAYGSSVDQIGVLARDAYDTALVLSVIAGKDHRDSTTLQRDKYDYTAALTGKIKPGMTFGIVEDMIEAEGMDPEVLAIVDATIKDFEKLGVRFKRIRIPVLQYCAAVYFIISRAEAASNLSRFDGVRYGLRNKDAQSLNDLYSETRHDGFGNEVRTRILVGNFVLSAGHADAFYQKARIVQQQIRSDLLDAFKDVDLLLTPTVPMPAFKIGAFDEANKLQLDLMDYFTCFANLAGLPGLSIPAGFTKERLPIGMQLVGPHCSEELLLQTAHAYQQCTDWHKQYPKGYEE